VFANVAHTAKHFFGQGIQFFTDTGVAQFGVVEGGLKGCGVQTGLFDQLNSLRFSCKAGYF
jgi:hypothetical protein